MLDTKLDSKDQDKKDMLSIFGFLTAIVVAAGIVLTYKFYGKPINHFVIKRLITYLFAFKGAFFLIIILSAILSPSKTFRKRFKDANLLFIGALMLTFSVLLFFPPKGPFQLQKGVLIANLISVGFLLVIPKIFFSI